MDTNTPGAAQEAPLVAGTVRVTLAFTVAVRDITPALVEETLSRYHNAPELMASPKTPIRAARDRRLLQAVLTRPDLRNQVLRRHVAFALTHLDEEPPIQDLIKQLGGNETVSGLLEEVVATLSSRDIWMFREAVAEDEYLDEYELFEAAWQVILQNVTLEMDPPQSVAPAGPQS